MIVWASMRFPPINLYTMPVQKELMDWHMKTKGKK